MKKLLIGLLILGSVSCFAQYKKSYENQEGDRIVLTFERGIPVKGSFINWGAKGNNILNRKIQIADYDENINVIRAKYYGNDWANFYLDTNNEDCLGYSGLTMVGPTNMCEFKSKSLISQSGGRLIKVKDSSHCVITPYTDTCGRGWKKKEKENAIYNALITAKNKCRGSIASHELVKRKCGVTLNTSLQRRKTCFVEIEVKCQ